jgi:hypothetical protein
MARSQWHKFYASKIAAAPELLFELLADLPNYGRWLPASGQFGRTTDSAMSAPSRVVAARWSSNMSNRSRSSAMWPRSRPGRRRPGR